MVLRKYPCAGILDLRAPQELAEEQLDVPHTRRSNWLAPPVALGYKRWKPLFLFVAVLDAEPSLQPDRMPGIKEGIG